MSEKKQSLVKNSIAYIVLGFLPMTVNLLLAPIYSQYISPEEYGIIALASIFQGLLATFISLGLEGAFSRFYFDYDRRMVLVKGLMSTILLTVIFVSVVVGVFLALSGDYIFDMLLSNSQFTYSSYGYIIFFTTLSTIIHAIFLSYYRNQENVKAYAIISLSFFLTSIGGILIGVIYFKAQAFGNIAGRAMGTTLISGALLLLYFLRNRLQFKKSYLKKCLYYSLPLMPYLILLIVYNNIDKIMIERYLNIKELGLYNFAFMISSVISVFIYAVFNAVSPQVYKLLTSGKAQDLAQVKQINNLFHLLVIGILSIAMAGVVPAIKLFIAEEYHVIGQYIGLLMLVYIFQVYYVIYTIPLFFHKKTKVLPWISLIVLVVGVVSNLIFIPMFGIYGVCLSLLITKAAQFFVGYGFIAYYGYQKGNYLVSIKNNIVSMAVIFGFLTLFVLRINEMNLSIELVNCVPIVLVMIGSWLYFRKEISSIGVILKDIING